jgi:rSAM/selenodomain-associated transferase 1
MENRLDNRGKAALIVFAKTPDAAVKTRIARIAGEHTARRVYRELLYATAATIRNSTYQVAFTGNDSPEGLREFFDSAASYFSQSGADLGSRMKNACLHCRECGYQRFIVIGCDCPERPAEDIALAEALLDKGADVVLGPAFDGGYHLAGVNLAGLVIFDATQWGSPRLLDETREIARVHGLNLALLTARSDIDTLEDYQGWKSRT